MQPEEQRDAFYEETLGHIQRQREEYDLTTADLILVLSNIIAELTAELETLDDNDDLGL